MKPSHLACIGMLSSAAGMLGGCSYTAHTAHATAPAAPRSVGLVAGDTIGRHSFADDGRIAWAPDLPWAPTYRSVMQQRRAAPATATVHVDTDR